MDDETDEDQQTKLEMKLTNEENSSTDDESEEEEEIEKDLSEEENADFIEQIREDILAYNQLNEIKTKNLSVIVNREELIYLFKCLYTHKTTVRENILTIGMVIN